MTTYFPSACAEKLVSNAQKVYLPVDNNPSLNLQLEILNIPSVAVDRRDMVVVVP